MRPLKNSKSIDKIVKLLQSENKLNNMNKQFEKLTTEERELLYKAPVLVSVLASCSLNEINEVQKADAIKLSHLKTFTADPLLLGYYAEVERNFKTQFEIIAKEYYPFDEKQRSALKEEICRVDQIISKLEKNLGQTLYKSLEKYGKHVKKATHTVFQDFIFPVPIAGLTD